MALAGHNSIVAPTGQEEVQYKVLTSPKFGLTDMQVRNWTNGPAFLTWSRGQNSHGVFELRLTQPPNTSANLMLECSCCQATALGGLCHAHSCSRNGRFKSKSWHATASLASLATFRPSVDMLPGTWQSNSTRRSQGPVQHVEYAQTRIVTRHGLMGGTRCTQRLRMHG